MNICVIVPRDGGVVTGVNTFNDRLAVSLRELGHTVSLAVSGRPFGFSELGRMQRKTGCAVLEIYSAAGKPGLPAFLEDVEVQNLARQLQPFDKIFVSGAHFNYARIIRAALGRRVFIVEHGNHISPLATNDIEAFKSDNVTTLCVNETHRQEAIFKGLGDRAVMFDLPIPFGPRAVLPAKDFCVAVGNLEHRKKYERVAEVAAALKTKCRVFGAAIDPDVLAFVENHPWLEYRGNVTHDIVLNEIAGAAFLIHMATVEGRPMAVLEAIGLGIFVIVPDTDLYNFVREAPWCVMLDPCRPVAEQTNSDIDQCFLAIKSRKALAKWAHEQYGDANLKKQLAELLQ